jgi:FAD/FMN-containing dehydrogenase
MNSKAFQLMSPDVAAGLETHGYAAAVALEGIKEAVDRMGSEIREMALESGAEKAHYLQGEQHHGFWNDYSNLVPGLSESYPDLVSIKFNYPISRYNEIIELADSLIPDTELDYALLSHAGNGIALIHFLVDKGDTRATERIITVTERLLDRCRDIGGNLVIERAKPELKERLPVWGLPSEDLILTRRIKELMDPLGLFCPGRFVCGI